MRKITIGLSAVLLVLLSAPMFAAFESYVINVKAQIENALTIDPETIDFGAVFPQEYVEQRFKVALSETFRNTERVDDIEYVIRNKPKCWNNNAEAPRYAPVHYATGECPDGFTEMATLCAYLSKTDGDPEDQNDSGVAGYFNSGRCTTPGPTDATGYLSKLQNDIEDIWVIDLKVPPISGYVGQDWPAACPVVAAEDYYGCDLWIEITAVSAKTFCGDGVKQTPNSDGVSEQCDGLDGVPRPFYRCTSKCLLEQITECLPGDYNFCNTGQFGVCAAGTNYCNQAGTWSGCQQNEAASPEICDGLDNDCDGAVDENLTRNTTCGLGACGQNTGYEACTNGQWANDTCNPNGGSSAEICDGQDNDCDGLIDENLSRVTYCGVGQCGYNTGTEFCENGSWSGNSCDPNAGAGPEICDGLDNDCDGQVDEGLSYPTSCGVGICAGNTGAAMCVNGQWADTCNPLNGGQTENCFNHLDDDCDGLTDGDDPQCKIACVEKGDVMLVLDKSGSIDEGELATLKVAAKGFADALAPSDDGFHFGQISFATYGSFDLHLTGVESSIYAAIDGLTRGGYTNLYHGIILATEELKNTNTLYERPEVQDFMVIITDGIPNRPLPVENARQLAKKAADAARAAGIMIYVLGVDDEVDANYLSQDIANASGQYYAVADYNQLATVLEEVANCK